MASVDLIRDERLVEMVGLIGLLLSLLIRPLQVELS